MGAPIASGADWATFQADIDLSLWADDTVFTPNVRGSDGNWDATPDTTPTFDTDDITPPEVTWDILSPPDAATVALSSNPLISVDYRDFTDYAAGTAEYRVGTAAGLSDVTGGWVAMNFDGWAEGCNENDFSFNVDSAVAVTWWYQARVTDTSTAPGLVTAAPERQIEFTDAAIAPGGPLLVTGFVDIYDGTVAGGYAPLRRSTAVDGAAVTVETRNATGVWQSFGPLNVDGLGRYALTLQGYIDEADEGDYAVGFPIWVNFTEAGPWGIDYRNESIIAAAPDGGSAFVNGTYGIPFNLDLEWIPWWNGIIPAPATNSYLPGVSFIVSANITTWTGARSIGYYGYVSLWGEDPSNLIDMWTIAFPGPYGIEFDGIGGAISDGIYNSTATFYTGGIWEVWANSTTVIGGANEPVLALGLVNYPWVNNTTNYTHVEIIGGGFFWRPIVGWNLISIPANVSGIFGLTFTASEAAQLVDDAATGAAIAFTEIVVSDHQDGTRPMAYDTWTHGVGGSDFVMDIDHCYWLYVDADLSAEGVFVQTSANNNGELELNWGPVVAGVNTVTIDALSFTMVNTGAGWSNNTIYNTDVVGHTDTRGNQGGWSAGTERIYTGGGWVPGIGGNLAWYSQTGIVPNGVYTGQGDNPGCWVDEGGFVGIQSAEAWDAATQTWTGNNYEAWFMGVDDPGQLGSNPAQRLFYASGFMVWSNAGTSIDMQVSYDWAFVNPEDAPAPYIP
jgi:hypothetical protein